MNEIFKNIQNAKHIELVAKPEFLAVASALYTYILRLHKKVSLVCKSKNIDNRFSFLPWFEKIKSSDTPSADLSIMCDFSAQMLYNLLQIEELKLNQKMATALYAALIDETKGFTKGVDGTTFALAHVLIESGAQHELCFNSLFKNKSLAFLRLKSLMLKKMLLQNSAKAALFCICDNDVKATGASVADAFEIMQEAFNLRYVEMAVLLNSDLEYEVITVMYKEN